MQNIVNALKNLTNPQAKVFGLALKQLEPDTVSLVAVDPTTTQSLPDGVLLSIVTVPGQPPKLVLHDGVNSEFGFDLDDRADHIIPYTDSGEQLFVM
jgi:hypothetical protein